MNLPTIAVTALLITMLVSPSDAHARIYKTVDKDGNVVFTDVPPKDKSKAVEIDAANVYTPPPAVAPKRTGSDQATIDAEELEELEEPVGAYSRLQIVTPEADQAVRENAGNLNVVVSLSPPLVASHQVQILLDGNVLATNAGTTLRLSNVDRGTHVLTAQIVDTRGNTLITSDPTSFHMQRISVNSPARAKP